MAGLPLNDLVELPPLTADAIVEKAQEFIGAPYLHGGRSRNGIDCYGLVAEVFRELGATFWDSQEYSQGDQLEAARQALGQFAGPAFVDVDGAERGDLLLFWGRALPQHFAICTEPGGSEVIQIFNGATVDRVVKGPLSVGLLRCRSEVWRYRNLRVNG